MASPLPQGRMLRKDISRSHKIAKLTPKATALFCLIIPHLSAFGKSNGDPMFVKSEMVPLIPWLTIGAIKAALKEIDRETNLKWFRGEDGCLYLHSLKWDEHQSLERTKRGVDRLPSHPSIKVDDQSTSSRRPVAPEVELEVEVKEKDKKELKEEVPAAQPLAFEGQAAGDTGNGSGQKELPAYIKSYLSETPEQLRKEAESLLRQGNSVALSTLLAGQVPMVTLGLLIEKAREQREQCVN